MKERNCVKCNKPFVPTKDMRRYCSIECRDRVECVICGSVFYRNGVRDTRKICDSHTKEETKKYIREKTVKTCIEKYGVENATMTDEVRKKIENTCMERYGVKTTLLHGETLEKIKQTVINKYGVDHPFHSKELQKKARKKLNELYKDENKVRQIVKKTKNTCIEKYGVDNVMKDSDFVNKAKNTYIEKYGENYRELFSEKAKKTNLERYGKENAGQVEEFKEKIRQTNLIKYGHVCALQSEEVKRKIKDTCIKKYGVESYTKTDNFRDYMKFLMSKRNNEEFKNKLKNAYYKKIKRYHFTQFHFDNFENFNKDFIQNNFIFNDIFDNEKFKRYFNISNKASLKYRKEMGFDKLPIKSCYGKETQHKLYKFIKDYYNKDVDFDNRKIIYPYELDIYFPDENIALEFDGVLYHSVGVHNVSRFNNLHRENFFKTRHLDKTRLCEEKNIKLFHIFENEWRNKVKRRIWLSIIKNSLNKIDKKIYARKCELKELSTQESKLFLEENHLQGYIIDTIRIGLYYENNLVSVMTFGKSRFNKNYDWELLRFCNVVDTVVIGAFSKLLKYFKKNYEGSIISYGNRRWTNLHNNVYNKHGKLIKETKPNYFYYHMNDKKLKLLSRVSCQKHKLKDLLENFDENLTESENMYNHGFRKIYDCGNLVYEL